VSGKRSLKKQQKRQASALVQLEELYRRGTPAADDELLAQATEQLPDLSASPFAAKWAEVAGRALRQSLGAADLDRLERLLRSLRRSGRPGPLAVLVLLAETVLDLAAGRRDAARSKLAVLSEPAAPALGTALPPGLLTALQALALDAPSDGGSAGSSSSLYQRAAAENFRGLQALEACAFAPAAADREDLARNLQSLRNAAPAAAEMAPDTELRRLLDGTDRYLSLLADLAAGPPPPANPAALASLAAALTAETPPLLAPLRHAVRLRWRSVLKEVAAREGPAGLAALCAADSKLLAFDLDLPGGPQSLLAALRQRTQARQLLAGGRHLDLAALLRTRSRTVADSGDLAALWSLELWASHHAAEDEFGEDGDPFADSFEPAPHRTLVRLRDMAGEIGRRFPAEHRAEVAQVLRGELFALCAEINFCDHTAETALSLLEHQPGDARGLGGGDLDLLIAGVAGAVASGDRRALRAFQERLARGGRAQAPAQAGQETVLSLMAQVAREEPPTIARTLGILRPCFGGDTWPQVAALVAREMGGSLVHSLVMTSIAAEHDPALKMDLDRARRDLDILRPLLAGTPGFAAAELILACWGPGSAAAEKRLEEFLAAFNGLDGVLTAFQMTEKTLSSRMPEGIEALFDRLVRTVIERLDDRWQLWWRDVPVLALAAGKDHLRRLQLKVMRLLASPDLQGQGREILEKTLEVIRQAKSKRSRGGRDKAPRPKAKKHPRGRAEAPQLRLDLP
jgi:hypothetical protein